VGEDRLIRILRRSMLILYSWILLKDRNSGHISPTKWSVMFCALILVNTVNKVNNNELPMIHDTGDICLPL
jgi:hypothetical protein